MKLLDAGFKSIFEVQFRHFGPKGSNFANQILDLKSKSQNDEIPEKKDTQSLNAHILLNIASRGPKNGKWLKNKENTHNSLNINF